MSLSPRAVALQGLGFVPRLVALQGLWPASPYRRAPKGAGYGARPVWGARPMQPATVRAAPAGTARPSLRAGSRPASINTTRPRR